MKKRITFLMSIALLGYFFVSSITKHSFVNINLISDAYAMACSEDPGISAPTNYKWVGKCSDSTCFNPIDAPEGASTDNGKCQKYASTDPYVNPASSYQCYGFGNGNRDDFRCIQLQYIGPRTTPNPSSSPSSTTNSCTNNIGNQSPDLGVDCASCIASSRSGIVGAVKGLNSNLFAGCSDREVINYWCNGGISSDGTSQCNSDKSGTCALKCSGSTTSPGQSSGTLTANPNPCTIPAGQTTCTTTISWTSSNVNVSGYAASNCGTLQGNSAIRNCSNYREDSYNEPNGASACASACSLSNANACEYSSVSKTCYKEFGSGCTLQSGFNGWISNVCSSQTVVGAVAYNPDWSILGTGVSGSKQVQVGTTPVRYNLYNEGPITGATGNGNPDQWLAAVTVSTVPTVTTVAYRIAENPADLDSAQWQPYTAAGMIIPHDFKTPGLKSIFVDFKDSTGKTERHTAQIKVLGPDPEVASCALSFEGDNTILNLTGQNFGAVKGGIKSSDGATDLQIRSWKDGSVQAVWPNAPAGQALTATLTNSDGQAKDFSCSASSQLSVGTRVFCGQSFSHDTDNVELILVSTTDTSTKIKQKVKIDKDGVVQGLNQKLDSSKKYKLSLKAPKSLRRTSNEFKPDPNGTTNVSGLMLPVGDIFPPGYGDGLINGLDRAELGREWTLDEDATGRPGDLNQDGRVNSLDWACMSVSMISANGRGDDPEPVPGVPSVSEGIVCGGIAGIKCPTGYDCKLDSNLPDASGKCVATAGIGVGSTAP